MNQSCGPSSLPSGALAAGVFGAELELAPEHSDLRTAKIDCQRRRLIFLLLFNENLNYVQKFWGKSEAKFEVQSAVFTKKNIACIDGQERDLLGTRQTIYGHTEKWFPGFAFRLLYRKLNLRL